MNSFYSIIYYKTNALTDERLALGILAGGGEGPFVYFSKARLELLRKTVHPNTFSSLRRQLKLFEEKIDKSRKESAGIMLFDTVISKEQLELLAKQVTGNLQYSIPTSINEWLDEAFFIKLRTQFLGKESTKKSSKSVPFYLKWRTHYSSEAYEGYAKNVLISELDEQVELPFKVDLLSTDSKTAYIGVDFDVSEYSLSKKIYEIETLNTVLDDYSIKIVSPKPRTNLGKDKYAAFTEKHNSLEFIDFSSLT